MIIQIFYVVFLLYIWFDTDGFIEYSKLFRLDKKFKIDLWIEYRELNPKMNYLSYIRLKHSSFFTRLISCKQCFCFWIVFLICLIFGNFLYFPIIYIMSYLIYNLICKLIK
jgi:hypothetical protein